MLSEAPYVAHFPGLFSEAECAYLIEAAEPLLQPAVIVHPVTGQLFRDPIRTSTAAAFPLAFENPAIHALNRRLAAATRSDVAQGEPLQILSYAPRQEYKPHHDAIPGAANQRIATILVYLNEGYEGGETHFPSAGLSFKGKAGDALMFRNTHDDGSTDEQTIHAGRPVKHGRKLIASRWIRAEPIDPMRPLR
jgi:prolyl 4-hydroxylase